MFKDTLKNKIGFGRMRMPKIKGHITIKQYYAKSGNLAEVIEQDNIVTNALADIFELDYLNGINANSLMPLAENWFGGILMYENAFATSGSPATIDPDNYFPPSDSNNHLYAHAGDVAPSDVADDTRRGSPNTIEKVIRDGYAKLAWEWGSSLGNVPDGHYIRSVALTHKDTGNCGLGSGSTAFASFVPLENISNLSSLTYTRGSFEETHALYDDNHGLSFYIGGLGEYQENYNNKNTNKVSVYIKRQAFFKTGLVDIVSGASNLIKRSFEVTTPLTFYMQPTYWFDRTNKYLWLFTNILGPSGFKNYAYSKTNIQYCIIDCENEELVNLGTEQDPVYYKTIVADTECLAPICNKSTEMDNDGFPSVEQVIGDGTTFYFPIGSVSGYWQVVMTGLLKVNISNNNQTKYEVSSGNKGFLPSGLKCGDLVAGNGFVVNDGFYICANAFTPSYNFRSVAFNVVDKVSSYASPIGTVNSTTLIRPIFANKMVHTTMLNLDSPIQKTNAKNMVAIYELEEETENE